MSSRDSTWIQTTENAEFTVFRAPPPILLKSAVCFQNVVFAAMTNSVKVNILEEAHTMR
jgi:hypothetical protein